MTKTIKEMIEIMQWFEDGGAVECANKGYDDWEIVTKPLWDWNDFDYRIKEFQYPMWFKDTSSNVVVRFDGLNSGEVIVPGDVGEPKGEYLDYWAPHTDATVWVEIEEPKSKQTITMNKWLMKRNDEYYILNTSKIDNYSLSTPVKLLETYEIEI